jgi:hypothetical protein
MESHYSPLPPPSIYPEQQAIDASPFVLQYVDACGRSGFSKFFKTQSATDCATCFRSASGTSVASNMSLYFLENDRASN